MPAPQTSRGREKFLSRVVVPAQATPPSHLSAKTGVILDARALLPQSAREFSTPAGI
ncbi:MAG TPA: hypothetical protein VER76_02650 [Pyrinomonadaceae bacterium]|nr:hypothetical protein [Pyrinomonadaceae bacterium]